MIRNKILSGTVIAAFAAILLAWAPSAAYAGNGGATVITEFGCSLIPADGGPGFTTDTHAVGNGNNVKMTCHFTGLTPQSPAFIKKGFLCGTPFGLTTNTMVVVDDEGNGMLRCIIHNT